MTGSLTASRWCPRRSLSAGSIHPVATVAVLDRYVLRRTWIIAVALVVFNLGVMIGIGNATPDQVAFINLAGAAAIWAMMTAHLTVSAYTGPN